MFGRIVRPRPGGFLLIKTGHWTSHDANRGKNHVVRPRLNPPLGFAHRGGRADAPDNTLEAFRKALEAGSRALESDAWATADGIVVLDHDGVAPGLRRRKIADVDRAELPGDIPSLVDLFAEAGTDFDLALDLRDASVGPAVAAQAREAGHDPARLWLVAADDLEAAAGWKSTLAGVRVADSTRRRSWKEGAERRAANMAEAGLDAVNLHHTDWSAGLVTLFHRFDVLCFAWDCQHDRVITDVLGMGVDGVFSDHVDRLAKALPPR